MLLPKITKISAQKNKERLNIYLDGVFSFGVKSELIADYDLFVGKELSQAQIKKIKDEDNLKKCLDKSYRYLSYRPRSEKEVFDKLSEKYEPAVVNKAIKRLKKQRYVDDVAFAQFWLEGRGRNRGPALIRAELFKKGISKEIIDEITLTQGKEDLVEIAYSLVKSKRKFQNLTKVEAYKKMAPFLSRRGFSYEVVKAVMDRIEYN